MLNDNESASIDSVLKTVVDSAKAQLASVSTGVHLVLAELRVVVSHAGLIVCLVIVAAGTILMGWGLLLVLGTLLLMGSGMSAVVAVLCMFLVNSIALIAIGISIRSALGHLSFKHTRQALSSNGSDLGYVG